MSRLTRRHFLTAFGGAALSGGILGPKAFRPPGSAEPERFYDLVARWKETTLDGTRVRLRSYNGEIPGPLLETRPGETLRIRLRNELTPYDSSAWNGNHNVPHMLNTTNLHLHGLEIMPHLFQPVGASDPTAEMIAIHPGEELWYQFHLPDDHPSGLFWYHPHHHGSTVVQAVTGMAGGLVVRGPIDEVPEIAAAREIFLVIEDIGLFPSEDDPDLWTYEPKQNAVWDTLATSDPISIWNPKTQKMEPAPTLRGGFTTGDYKLRYYLINGQPFYREEHNYATGTKAPPGCPPGYTLQQDPVGAQLDVPVFSLRPGEVVRFRMLNAGSDDLMPVVVEGHELHLIALDGVNFPAPRTIPEKPVDGAYGDQQLLLAPANRAEFLLRAGAPGVYKIVQLEQCVQFLRSAARTLAEIVVEGVPFDPPMGIPRELPLPIRHYPLLDPRDVRQRRNVVFSMAAPGGLNPIVGLDFMINNALYDEASIQAVVKVDTVEEWRLRVPDADHGGTEGHPFHVHVNSFEVISINGEEQPPGTIRDTIWVEPNGEVVIRMKFRQWTGKSVYHCHILPHEDTGMMQNFLITD
ncbi:multicopper oxidase family protein [Rhodocaloribacter sp.]